MSCFNENRKLNYTEICYQLPIPGTIHFHCSVLLLGVERCGVENQCEGV